MSANREIGELRELLLNAHQMVTELHGIALDHEGNADAVALSLHNRLANAALLLDDIEACTREMQLRRGSPIVRHQTSILGGFR